MQGPQAPHVVKTSASPARAALSAPFLLQWVVWPSAWSSDLEAQGLAAPYSLSPGSPLPFQWITDLRRNVALSSHITAVIQLSESSLTQFQWHPVDLFLCHQFSLFRCVHHMPLRTVPSEPSQTGHFGRAKPGHLGLLGHLITRPQTTLTSCCSFADPHHSTDTSLSQF